MAEVEQKSQIESSDAEKQKSDAYREYSKKYELIKPGAQKIIYDDENETRPRNNKRISKSQKGSDSRASHEKREKRREILLDIAIFTSFASVVFFFIPFVSTALACFSFTVGVFYNMKNHRRKDYLVMLLGALGAVVSVVFAFAVFTDDINIQFIDNIVNRVFG